MLTILVSLFLHVVVGFSLAAFGSMSPAAPPLEEKPVELTFVDLSAQPPPSAPKDPPFMETAPNNAGSDVTRYRPIDNSVRVIATLPTVIVGAGVSTCAPAQ